MEGEREGERGRITGSPGSVGLGLGGTPGSVVRGEDGADMMRHYTTKPLEGYRTNAIAQTYTT